MLYGLWKSSIPLCLQECILVARGEGTFAKWFKCGEMLVSQFWNGLFSTSHVTTLAPGSTTSGRYPTFDWCYMKIDNYTIIKEQARVSCLLNTFSIKSTAKYFLYYVILLSWLFLILSRPINLWFILEIRAKAMDLLLVSDRPKAVFGVNEFLFL